MFWHPYTFLLYGAVIWTFCETIENTEGEWMLNLIWDANIYKGYFPLLIYFNSHLASKFQKVVISHWNKFVEEIITGMKKTNCYTDFKTVEKVAKTFLLKKLLAQNFDKK
jgi:hypothetical protein